MELFVEKKKAVTSGGNVPVIVVLANPGDTETAVMRDCFSASAATCWIWNHFAAPYIDADVTCVSPFR